MSQINCPHCGFVNFAISAYCGRCERPLPPPDGEKPSTAPNPTIRAMPPRARHTPPPPPPNAPPDERPSTPPIERIRAHQALRPLSPVLSNEPTQALPAPGSDGPTVVQQAPTRPQPVAAPRPQRTEPHHDEPTVVRSVSVPDQARAPDKFEALYDRAVANQPRVQSLRDEGPARRRPLDEGPLDEAPLDEARLDDGGPLEMGDGMPEAPAPVRLDTDPTKIPASQPAYWRLIVAFCVDATAVGALGAGMVASEMILFAGHWPTENGALAALGEWLALYPGTAVRAGGIMGAAGLIYAAWGGKNGATLGRKATRLLALSKQGQRLGWTRAVLRSLLAGVSLGLCGAGYFWAVVDKKKRAWHDILTGTRIVHHRAR